MTPLLKVNETLTYNINDVPSIVPINYSDRAIFPPEKELSDLELFSIVEWHDDCNCRYCVMADRRAYGLSVIG